MIVGIVAMAVSGAGTSGIFRDAVGCASSTGNGTARYAEAIVLESDTLWDRQSKDLTARIEALRQRLRSNRATAMNLIAMSNEKMPRGLPEQDRKTWPKYMMFLRSSGVNLQDKVSDSEKKLDRFVTQKQDEQRAILALRALEKSFNAEYLALRQKMLINSRQFALMSNVMKTKHVMARSAINNIR